MSTNGHGGGLNIPGFSFGQKTGEYIDVPRIFGGHGVTRRSQKPHSTAELLGGRIITATRKALVLSTRNARQEHNKDKRIRAKQAQKPITQPSAVPCFRRFLEHSGLKTYTFAYAEEPELITPKPRTIYEVTDGLLPFCTYTSAREAQILCVTLAMYGIAAIFNQIQLY